MKVFVVSALVFCSHISWAEQPRGTYLLDRGALTNLTREDGRPYPSCGSAKVFGGQATFHIEYGKQIVVNGRQWRFRAYGVEPGHSTPRPDAPVYIADPESKDRIEIVFATDGRAAGGSLQVTGQRSGTMCADAWELTGSFSAATR